MSDLSLNDTLDPLESTNTHEANVEDNTPEDWESVIDFEMKNNEGDSNLENANQHELALMPNEPENPEKEESIPMEVENETSLGGESTEAAHEESDNAMEREKTQLTKQMIKQTIWMTLHPNPKRQQAPSSHKQPQMYTYQFPNMYSNVCCKRAS
jgi:hypothetical protein